LIWGKKKKQQFVEKNDFFFFSTQYSIGFARSRRGIANFASGFVKERGSGVK
jgi:hypothetical protein